MLRVFGLFTTIFIIILLIIFYVTGAMSSTRFTNVKCETNDPSFLNVTLCKLRVIKRGLIGANVYIKLYKLPLTYVKVDLGLFKKANDFKPFLYNISLEYCSYAKNPKSNFVLSTIMPFITEYSNINHTCPFVEDIIIRDLILPEEKIRRLPLPAGEYLLRFHLSDKGGLKLMIDAIFMRSDENAF